MGRARKPGAKCYVMIDRSIEGKETSNIAGFTDYNQCLSAALRENTIHVGEEDEQVPHYRAPIEPFRPSGDPNGPAITHNEAISIIHR